MAIQFGTVDGLVNISTDTILCFTKGIEEFERQGGPAYASSEGISYGTAFQRFIEPVYTDKTKPYTLSSIKQPVHTRSGEEQSPARVTFCKKMGLLNVDEPSSIFSITPLGKAVLDNDITIKEYAFILLSNMGVFKDGVYIDNLLCVISSYFLSHAVISQENLGLFIKEKYNDSKIVKTRLDIIINSLVETGLVTKTIKDTCVLSGLGQAEVFSNFYNHSLSINKAEIDTSDEYADYIGKMGEGGIFSILSTENADVYLKYFPGLKKYVKNKITPILNPAIPKTSADRIQDSYRPFITAIKSKPFLILGGFSGTGKSQKVKELAYLTCPSELQGEKAPGNYALISVKPNWHDSTELLGYESTIASKYMVTDFMRFVVKAMQTPNTPFFCCMDEMNLAPVEEYFAEFLSVLESRKKIQYEDGTWHIVSEPLVSADVFKKSYKGKDADGVYYNIFEDLGLKKVTRTVGKNEAAAVGDNTETTSELFEREDIIALLKRDGLCIPENLVVIGTVNMDDTTNSFSRKVIDRAMIFETDIETFDKDAYFGAKDTLQYGNVDGASFICDEVRADKAIEAGYELSEDDRQTIIDYINDLNKAMAGTSFQISYRVLNEMILYYRSMQLLNDGQVSLEQVKNDILMMKVLPRIEGDSAAQKALVGLKSMIEKQNIPSEWINVPYDMDAETISTKPETPWKDSILKIAYMLNLLNTGDGFTRFWK
jgi:hypothetical protein